MDARLGMKRSAGVLRAEDGVLVRLSLNGVPLRDRLLGVNFCSRWGVVKAGEFSTVLGDLDDIVLVNLRVNTGGMIPENSEYCLQLDELSKMTGSIHFT